MIAISLRRVSSAYTFSRQEFNDLFDANMICSATWHYRIPENNFDS